MQRYFMVVNEETKKTVYEEILAEGQNNYLQPLNIGEGEEYMSHQWTGELFKNQPPIFYGYLGITFGCPYILLLNKENSKISIFCDNRH